MPAVRSIMNVKNCVLAGGLLIAALSPCVAAAALGGLETSIQADAAQLRGSMKVAQHASYRSHEIQLPSGTMLREFAAMDGKVFAVAWSGPSIPNLRQTLGVYFDNYVTAAKARHAGRHHLEIHQSDLVVLAAGHMRAFAGLAYLPPAVPDGVTVGDLQ
jgi:hypothetical protein